MYDLDAGVNPMLAIVTCTHGNLTMNTAGRAVEGVLNTNVCRTGSVLMSDKYCYSCGAISSSVYDATRCTSASPAPKSSEKLQLIDPDVKGERLLICVDFNAPLIRQERPHQVHQSAHVQGALPTIWYCLDNGTKSVVSTSHLGSPNGDKMLEKLSLAPLAKALRVWPTNL